MTTQAFKPNNSLCYWNFLPNYSYVKLLMYRQHEKPLIKDLPSSSFHLSLHGTCRLHHSLKLAWILQNFSEPPSGPTKKCVLFSDWLHLFNIRWQKHDDSNFFIPRYNTTTYRRHMWVRYVGSVIWSKNCNRRQPNVVSLAFLKSSSYELLVSQ